MKTSNPLPDALAEVLRLAAAATQGKWLASDYGGIHRTKKGGGFGSGIALTHSKSGCFDDWQHNTRLIAAAVNFIRQHGSEIMAMADDARRKQARIDELMFEWCPDEMTEEQIVEWARHQVPVPDSERKAIDAAIDALNPIAKESP